MIVNAVRSSEALSGAVARCEAELLRRGAGSLSHSRWSLYEHLTATFQILQEWGQCRDVCLAGLMHSVYSTEAFNHCLFAVQERDVVRDLIGDQAEQLVYIFCSTQRSRLFDQLAHLDHHAGCSLADVNSGAAINLTPSETGNLLIIHMANQAEQACRPDGFPSASLAKMSQYGNWARSRVDALPPVFNRCKRIVTPAEEQHLLTAYLAATSSFSPDDDDDVTGKLKLAAEAAPWVAEPFVWLGLLALAHNELPSMAHSHGTRAKDILRAWNTPWDKRLSGIAWLSIAEWLSQTAGLSDDARRFLAHRLTRIFQCSASPVQSLYTQLDSRSSFSFTPAVALQQGEEPIDELFADRLQALPPRFADYALYFGEQLNPKMMNFYPDLEAKPWHDASTFELARDLERMAPEIIREFEALDKTKLHPETERIRREGSWDVFMLFERGKKRQENCALFPVTTSIIESHKTVRNLVGLVYFSRMAPGTIIAPHKGPTNMRLRCHLGIHVPKNCDITVDGITRTWQSGKCLVFDDSFNHEAKNLSDEERVVLIVDVWHPDLSDHEVALLSGLQRYIENTAQGLSGYWDRNESACLRDHR